MQFTQKVRDSRQRTALAEIDHPFAEYGRIHQRLAPENMRQTRGAPKTSCIAWCGMKPTTTEPSDVML